VLALAAFLRHALSPDAEPEASDVVFTLSLLPPPPAAAPPAPAGSAASAAAASGAASGATADVARLQAAEAAFKASVLGASLLNLGDLLADGRDAAPAEPLPLEAHAANIRALAARYAATISQLAAPGAGSGVAATANGAAAGGSGWLGSAADVSAAVAGGGSGVLADVSVSLRGVRALQALLPA
jgi:hypothetical protein